MVEGGGVSHTRSTITPCPRESEALEEVIFVVHGFEKVNSFIWNLKGDVVLLRVSAVKSKREQEIEEVGEEKSGGICVYCSLLECLPFVFVVAAIVQEYVVDCARWYCMPAHTYTKAFCAVKLFAWMRTNVNTFGTEEKLTKWMKWCKSIPFPHVFNVRLKWWICIAVAASRGRNDGYCVCMCGAIRLPHWCAMPPNANHNPAWRTNVWRQNE